MHCFCLPLLAGLIFAASDVPSASWELVWSDEFDIPGLPDASKWDYEEGFVRNEEAQYYTRARRENARVENGCLIIEGRKEVFKNAKYNPDGKNWQRLREHADYTAASIITKGKASWTYGRIEVRAKLPQGKGVWPALWTLGTNITEIGWPRCGELDIMEFVGKEPEKIHATVHWSRDGKHASQGKSTPGSEPWKDFHIYAMDWYPDHIDFYYDKTMYHRYEVDPAGQGEDNPFRKPHYLLINLALGGSWGGEIDDSIFPQQYQIDYVRVYKQKQAL